MADFYEIHPDNPNERYILKAVEIFRNNGIVIYPTDTVYGLGFRYSNKAGIQRVAQVKGIKTKQTDFSFIFSDISEIEEYTKPLEKWIFKLMKKNLPGPFTFILPASSKISKELEFSRKNIGIRIPDNKIIRAVIKELGEPVMNASVHDDDEIIEYTTDPELIYDKFKNVVDLVINGGFGSHTPSTVIDCSGNEPEIIRQGAGDLEL